MRYLLLIALLIATPAYAKDVTITMTDAEQKVFLSILDGALKQGGLANLQAVTQFVTKYQKAAAPDPAAVPGAKKDAPNVSTPAR